MPAHRKAIETHLLEGTYRKDRHAENLGGYKTLEVAPPCPASIISKKAREAWESIMPILTSSGRLAAEDIPGLELAFRSYGIAYTLQKDIEGLDPIQDTSKLRMLTAIANTNAVFFTSVLERFGFSSKGREALAQTSARQKLKNKPSLSERMTK